MQARQIGKGDGYNDPFLFLPGASHRSTPAADHPPLTVFAILPIIAAGDRIGFAESTTQLIVRFEMLVIGLFVLVTIIFVGAFLK